MMENQKTEFATTTMGYYTSIMDITPETVVRWNEQIKNIKNISDLKELFIRFMNCKEYLDSLTVRKEDEDVLNYASRELGSFSPEFKLPECICSVCNLNSNCSKLSLDMKTEDDCEEFENVFLDIIPDQILKGYFLTFYDDLAEKYLPKKYNKYTGKTETKHLPISFGDKMLLKQNGNRLLSSASVIFMKHKELSSNLKVLSAMIEAGSMDKDLVEIIKLKGIGIVKAKALVKAGIKTQGEFLVLSKYNVSKILGCTIPQAEKLLNENLL